MSYPLAPFSALKPTEMVDIETVVSHMNEAQIKELTSIITGSCENFRDLRDGYGIEINDVPPNLQHSLLRLARDFLSKPYGSVCFLMFKKEHGYATNNSHNTPDAFTWSAQPSGIESQTNATETGAMRTALGTTELLEVFLSHLSTRDLGCARRVSDAWQQTILGSLTLRRKLFLDNTLKKSYLVHDKVESQNLWRPVILSGPQPPRHSWMIAEPHPILPPGTKHGHGVAYNMRCHALASVPRSTFVSQPPLTTAWVQRRRIVDPNDLTFGAILKELERQRVTSRNLRVDLFLEGVLEGTSKCLAKAHAAKVSQNPFAEHLLCGRVTGCEH